MVARTAKTAVPDVEPDTKSTETATVPNIAVALSQVMEHVRAVEKGGYNTFQKFNFRGIDDVMNAVGPALRKAHVVIVPSAVLEHEILTASTSQSKTTNAVRVRVQYTAYGPAGDSITMEAVGEAQDTADKGTAKAMSVAYRTLLLQAFTLPTDQPDPDSEDAVPYAREQVQETKPVAPVWNQQIISGGIMAANGNVDALRAFHQEAEAGGCPPQGLKMIADAGRAAAAFNGNKRTSLEDNVSGPDMSNRAVSQSLEDLKKAGAVAEGRDVWNQPAALDTSLDPTAPDPADPIDADAQAAWLAQNGG